MELSWTLWTGFSFEMRRLCWFINSDRSEQDDMMLKSYILDVKRTQGGQHPRFLVFRVCCSCQKPWDSQLLFTKNFGDCGEFYPKKKHWWSYVIQGVRRCEFLAFSIDIWQSLGFTPFDACCDVFFCFGRPAVTYLASNFLVETNCNMIGRSLLWFETSLCV